MDDRYIKRLRFSLARIEKLYNTYTSGKKIRSGRYPAPHPELRHIELRCSYSHCLLQQPLPGRFPCDEYDSGA